MSIATATIVGRVARDPETKTIPSGKSVTTFSVGVDHGFSDNKQVFWFDIVCWEKLAENVPKFVKKGSLVSLTGRLQTRSWDDKDTGKKVYKTEIVATDVQREDSRSEGATGEAPARAAAQPAARTAPAPVQRASTPIADGTFITDEDFNF